MANAALNTDLQLCVQHITAGRFAEAAPVARRLLSYRPEFSFFLYLHGLICGRLGHQAEALEALQRAIAVSDRGGDKAHTDDMRGMLVRPEMRMEIGNLFAGDGRWSEAIHWYRQAIELRPNFPEAHARMQAALERGAGPAPLLVTVITATTGRPELAKAIESVQRQTYANIEHLLVVDYPQSADRVREFCERLQGPVPSHCVVLPYNTGAHGFNGHRIYGASVFIARGEFVAFLDEDNWFDADHLASLMERVVAEGLEWAYSLRKICRADGSVVAVDNGNSLGKWSTATNDELHLVDANCYLLRRDIAVRTCAVWNARFPDVITYVNKHPVVSPDYALCMKLLAEYPRSGSNGQYSANYRVGSAAYSADEDFFRRMNAMKCGQYPGKLPWVRSEVVFLQIGAGDGTTEGEGDWIYRNVIKFGWRGILVEPLPQLYGQLIETYAGKSHGLYFEQLAIDAHDERREFSICHRRPELSSFSPATIGRWDPDGKLGLLQSVETISVHCMRMATLLGKYGLSRIDVLHMDAGGHEAEILETIDPQLLKIGTIRFAHRSLARDDRDKVCARLALQGYAVTEESAFTTAVLGASGNAGREVLEP
jgi:FkbM family methyltransferase